MYISTIGDTVGHNYLEASSKSHKSSHECELTKVHGKKASSLAILKTNLKAKILSSDHKFSKPHSFKIKKTQQKPWTEVEFFKEVACYKEGFSVSGKSECDAESSENPLQEYFDSVERYLEGEKVGIYITHSKFGGNVIFSIVLQENPTLVKHYSIEKKCKKDVSPFQVKVAVQLVMSGYKNDDAMEKTLVMLKEYRNLSTKYSRDVYCKMSVGTMKILFAEENQGGLFLERIRRLDEGALGKVYRVGSNILKQAKVKSLNTHAGNSKEKLYNDIKVQAQFAIINEFKILNYIHSTLGSDSHVKPLGIQDRPMQFMTIRSLGKEGQIKVRVGFLGRAYTDSLSALIGKCSTKRVLSYMFQIFCGLDFLERLGIYHGDIKPDNMFYRGKKVCIADFGGAKKILKMKMRASCFKILTKHYVCPKDTLKINAIEAGKLGDEEKRKKINAILIKSDMYAACVSFLELVMGMKLIDAVKYLYETSEHFTFNLLDPILQKELKAKGFPDEIIKHLLLGISSSYKDRPKAIDFLKILEGSLENSYA